MSVVRRIAKQFSFVGLVSIVVIVSAFLWSLTGLIGEPLYKIPTDYTLQSPNPMFWFGTDDLGIDLYEQVKHGFAISFLIGMSVAVVAGLGGSIVGTIAGYYGGHVDKFVTAVSDLFMVIPQLPLLIVLGATLGPSVVNIILVISLIAWTMSARIIRAKVQELMLLEYVQVAQSYGAGFWHIFIFHLIPSLMPLVFVQMIRLLSRAIIMESSLAFLGLGDPLSKTLGAILNRAINFSGIYFTPYWSWWIVVPATSILLLVMAFAFISKDAERILNRKLQ